MPSGKVSPERDQYQDVLPGIAQVDAGLLLKQKLAHSPRPRPKAAPSAW